jgi:hypothetical protein
MFPFILKKKIQKKAKTFVRSKNFYEYAQIKRVLLLFDIDRLDHVQAFVGLLRQEGKEVVAYTFEAKVRKEPLVLPKDFYLLTKQNTDILNIPLKPVIQAFTADKADTVMDLSIRGDLVLRYLYLHTKADFRIGFNVDSPEWYDLTIEAHMDQEYGFLLSQLHFYLKTLRTK